ncbi:thiamine-binding protein [Paradesulfitobacterium ferrireducens]|uniref:thiamine-binding protein n=1 Tax=Paradesulfitobacterium ferrireducens TaxID=2816476 RepID=UPI001A8E39BC|nr:thiamine-binding protein [Paradesulfitobacterium ferrireducens]
MPKITMSFQVIPFVEESRIYEVVDAAIEVVAQSGVTYEVGPLETAMEGEPETLWRIIREAQNACIQAGASRVLTNIKMDYVPSGSTIAEKIEKYRG